MSIFSFAEFVKLFKRPAKNIPVVVPKKREKHGHSKTPMAFCLVCFKEKKKKFWLSRYNSSSVKSHMQHTHKAEPISHEKVVSETSPAAKEALKAYEKLNNKG